MATMHEQDDLRQILDDDGNVLPGATVPDVPDEDLARIFDVMLQVRVMDERMMRLQRQGRLGFYMKSVGEEASHFAVYPLLDKDWIFPSYREQGAWFWRGYTAEQYINQLFGNEKDPIKGRQMPVHHSANWLHLVSISSPVGTQIPQAVGAAYAAKIQKTGAVTMVYFGEGTSSSADFHVGMNFAGVLSAPCVFVCRNNGWAISVPLEKQTASRTFAEKAIAYGMPGIQVDGNDILAVIQVAREAIERARSGGGPTLIEAKTYRVQGHSSSDDPSVYRNPDEPAAWERKDPVKRLRGYMKTRGIWSEQRENEIREAHNQAITRALEASESLGTPPLDSIFEEVFEEMPKHLVEQRAYLMQQARVKSPHKH